MKGQFIIGTGFLKCAAHLGNGILLGQGLRIVNDKKPVSILKQPSFLESAGQLEVEYLRTSEILIVSDTLEIPDKDPHGLINDVLNIVRSFFSALWLIREHSALFDRGYFIESSGSVHSNTQVTAHYNHRGLRSMITFSRTELESANRFLRASMRDLSESFELPPERHIMRKLPSVAHKEVPLDDRFRAFVEHARCSIDMPMRISMACSALESVLSTSSSELTHRVSERAAFLLSNAPEERRRIYDDVKMMYGIRSKFVHGDTLGKKEQISIENHSKRADEILRLVAHQLLGNHEFRDAVASGKDDIDRYHSDLLFGVRKAKQVLGS